MTATIEFFPVGNGDMTLVTLESGKRILIDINIRQNADNEAELAFPNVASMLKERLDRDIHGRLFVDVFVLSHPDRDHCAGLTTHFHLDSPNDWKTPAENEIEKIIIREIWSSPLTFRRKNKIDGTLTSDAEAWRKEAKRRVKLFKENSVETKYDGNKIMILGQDIHNKTNGLDSIIVKVGERFDRICGIKDPSFSGLLLSPQLVSEEEAEELSGKNNSSIVMQFTIASDNNDEAAKFLTGGDAEVDIWERIWKRNKNHPNNLAYNILQTPHHCSLGTLSHDRYNDDQDSGIKGKEESCEISTEAYNALSQSLDGSFIIASADKPENKTGRDLAMRKYLDIAKNCNGKFLCTMIDSKNSPLKITITSNGPNDTDKKEMNDTQSIPQKVIKGSTEGSYA